MKLTCHARTRSKDSLKVVMETSLTTSIRIGMAHLHAILSIGTLLTLFTPEMIIRDAFVTTLDMVLVIVECRRMN